MVLSKRRNKSILNCWKLKSNAKKSSNNPCWSHYFAQCRIPLKWALSFISICTKINDLESSVPQSLSNSVRHILACAPIKPITCQNLGDKQQSGPLAKFTRSRRETKEQRSTLFICVHSLWLLLYFTINNTSSRVFISFQIFCSAKMIESETANTNWYRSSLIHFSSNDESHLILFLVYIRHCLRIYFIR